MAYTHASFDRLYGNFCSIKGRLTSVFTVFCAFIVLRTVNLISEALESNINTVHVTWHPYITHDRKNFRLIDPIPQNQNSTKLLQKPWKYRLQFSLIFFAFIVFRTTNFINGALKRTINSVHVTWDPYITHDRKFLCLIDPK